MFLDKYFRWGKRKAVALSRNRKLVLYLFFVAVALVFWFLHSLGKEYVTNVNVKVAYTNFPMDKEPQGNTVQDLTLNVQGFGFSIIRMQLKSAFYDYKIDVSKLKKQQTGNNMRCELSISAIRNQFETQLGSGIVINSVFPEDVNFYVKKMGVKKVPIRSALRVGLKSGYMLVDKPITEPDSVVVRGELAVVDTLQFIYTEELSFDKVDAAFTKKVALQSGNVAVELYPKYAKLSYDVAEYIDEERVLKVRPLNFPDSAIVALQPEEITLRYRTHAKAQDSRKSEDFLLVVDYNTLTDFSQKLEVQPITLPKGISNVYMEPRYVNYMITYKK